MPDSVDNDIKLKLHHQNTLIETNPVKHRLFRREINARMREIKNDKHSSQYDKDAKLYALQQLYELSKKQPNHSIKQVIEEWEQQPFRYSHSEFSNLIQREINRIQDSHFSATFIEEKTQALQSLQRKLAVFSEKTVSKNINQWKNEKDHWKVVERRSSLGSPGSATLIKQALAAERLTNGQVVSQQRSMVKNPLGSQTTQFLQQQKNANSNEFYQYDEEIFNGDFGKPRYHFRTHQL